MEAVNIENQEEIQNPQLVKDPQEALEILIKVAIFAISKDEYFNLGEKQIVESAIRQFIVEKPKQEGPQPSGL